MLESVCSADDFVRELGEDSKKLYKAMTLKSKRLVKDLPKTIVQARVEVCKPEQMYLTTAHSLRRPRRSHILMTPR